LALVFANPTKAGIAFPARLFDLFDATWGQNTTLLENLGVVVGTPNDVATVEDLLKLAVGSLAGGKMQHATLQYLGKDKKLSVLLRGDRLYVGFTDRSVISVAESLSAKESLAATMDLPGGMRMASRDALVHIGLGAWKVEWDNWVTATLSADKHDEAALELADSFAAIMRRTTSFLLGIKLDKGVEVSLLALLSRDDEAVLERFQLLLGKGDAPPTLSGLPHDDALGAFATRGNRPSDYFVTQALLSLPLHVEVPVAKRIMLASAFRKVWNQVQGTRAAVYSFAKPVVVVVLDTNDPKEFIDRLIELVNVRDKISVELADGDELKAIDRVAITEKVFDGRTAYLLSLTHRGVAAIGVQKLTLVPVEKKMVLSFDEDDAPLRQAIKNVTADMPRRSLAEHPGILESYKRLPARREMELHFRLSEILNMMTERKLVGVGPAEYSSASLALGKTSLELDVWIPLGELANFLMLYGGEILRLYGLR